MKNHKLISLLFSLVFALVACVPQSDAAAEGLITKLKNNLYVTGNITTGTWLGQGLGGANSVIITSGNSNGIVAKAKEVSCNVGTGSAALSNSTTYTYTLAAGRAGTVQQVTIAAATAPVGGTNTVTITKNGSGSVLASTFNPTTLTNYVGQMPALTATTSNLTLASTDVLVVTWTTGAQTTAAVAPVITVEMLPNDY